MSNSKTDYRELETLGIPFLSWEDAMDVMDWKQGEHVTLIGPTGRGKTEMMIALLDERTYKVFITTKRVDDTQQQLVERNYRVESDVAMINQTIARKFLFRTPWTGGIDNYDAVVVPRQRSILKKLLLKLFEKGSWTIALDELPYLSDQLKLDSTLKLLWLQGRSGKNSMIVNTQRPRNVPLEAYSMASHLFIFNTPDTQDIMRSGDLVALDRDKVVRALRATGKHDVLYVNVNDGDMCVTNTRK